MTDGVVSFEIQLDDPTASYSPGEIISGKLIIELNRKKKLRALKLRFKGECQVHWTHRRGAGSDRKIHHYRGVETYFSTDVFVLGNTDNESIEMQPGYHVFPFSYNLPRNIPGSFEHMIGTVRYSIKAIVDRPWKFDHTVSKFIRIENSEDWDPSFSRGEVGIDDNIQKTFRDCLLPCINLGKMVVRFRVPTTVFRCGDSIEATVNIDNYANHVEVASITMKLKQKLDFHAQTSSRVKHEVDEVQTAEKIGPFPNNTEVKIGLQVPALPFTSFKYCKLIDINYDLRIEVHVSGCHVSVARTYDVVIGRRSSILPERSSYPAPAANFVAPSAPQLMPDQMSSPIDLMQHKTCQYNFPAVHENSANSFPQGLVPIPSHISPYPPAMSSGTGGVLYPPQNIHQLPEIGFVGPSSTPSRVNNPHEPPPPSYDSVMAEGRKNFHN